MGVGSAFIWAPLAATATRNLPPQSGRRRFRRLQHHPAGGLGAGRSAGMAAFMTSRISAEMPPMPSEALGEGSVAKLPAWLHDAVRGGDVAVAAAARLLRAVRCVGRDIPARLRQCRTPRDADLEDADRRRRLCGRYGGDEAFVDDDEYVEYTVSWDEPESAPLQAVRSHSTGPRVPPVDESVTTPLDVHVEHPLPAPADEARRPRRSVAAPVRRRRGGSGHRRASRAGARRGRRPEWPGAIMVPTSTALSSTALSSTAGTGSRFLSFVGG